MMETAADMKIDKAWAAGAALCLASATHVQAQTPERAQEQMPASTQAPAADLDALRLGVATAPSDESHEDASNWGKGLRLEAWAQQYSTRAGVTTPAKSTFNARAVADYRHEWTLSASTRAWLSDRIEASNRANGQPSTWRNALREAAVSWRLGEADRPAYLDAGRIVMKAGSAAGYNPTDFFKAKAVVTQTTLDPAALRENRLGTVMLRGQAVQPWGSFTMAAVPSMSSRDTLDESAAALGLERTNRQSAVYVKASPDVKPGVSLDIGALARQADKPRLGLSSSWLVSDAWVAAAEWSGSHDARAALPGQAAQAKTWTNRWAANISWTAPWGTTFTLEHDYAGDALSRAGWQAWRDAVATNPAQHGPSLGRLIDERVEQQEPLVQRSWYARAVWLDAVKGVDVSAFVRRNAYDRSRLWQVDASWHVNAHNTVSVLTGRFEGGPLTQYGLAPQRNYVSVYLTHYLH